MKNQSAGVAQLGNWYAVAAVAAASFGLAAGAQQADAAQVVVHPVGGPVTAPRGASSTGGLVFNVLDTTGTEFVTVPPAVTSPGSLNIQIGWVHPTGGTFAGVLVAGRPGVASLLVRGASSPADHYAAKLGGYAAINSSVFSSGARAREAAFAGESASGAHIGSWQPGDTGFLGLAVFTSASASQPVFGWAEIHLGSNFDPTLIAWGFNTTPGATDFTPNLPEPSSLLLLASGAAGLAAYRRRRVQRRAGAA